MSDIRQWNPYKKKIETASSEIEKIRLEAKTVWSIDHSKFDLLRSRLSKQESNIRSVDNNLSIFIVLAKTKEEREYWQDFSDKADKLLEETEKLRIIINRKDVIGMILSNTEDYDKSIDTMSKNRRCATILKA